MIRARLSTTSHVRDDALTYLRNAIATEEWAGWERAGDIMMSQKRTAATGVKSWTATTVLVRAEDT